jgi:S-formylglutathione hydrolase FrmB
MLTARGPVRLAAFVVLLGVSGSAAPVCVASQVVTLRTPTPFVDAAATRFGQAPICVKCAPHPADALYTNVFLPEGYDGKRRFPVVYLLHGGDGQYDFWLQSPRENDPRGPIVPNLVQDLRAVIVMPDAGADGHYADWWNGGRRGSPAWERYHLDQLIPLVERRFKIKPGRRFHAITGYSMGGYGAAYYATQRPGYFGIVAALSARLSLFDPVLYGQLDYAFGDPRRQRFYWAGHDPTTLVHNLRSSRVYVSVGDGRAIAGEPSAPESLEGEKNLARMTQRFRSAARQAHVPVTFRALPGGHNYDAGWRALHAGFLWIRSSLGRTLVETPRTWTFSTVAQRSEAHGFRFTFGRPPRELATFARGRTSLHGRGAGPVTVRDPRGHTRRVRLPFDLRLGDRGLTAAKP